MSTDNTVICEVKTPSGAKCGKTFPAELREVHYDEAHASDFREKALSQMRVVEKTIEKQSAKQPSPVEEKVEKKTKDTAPAESVTETTPKETGKKKHFFR